MAPTQTYPKVLHADQEHAGLRTAVFALLFLSLILAFFGLRALLGAVGTGWMAEYAFALSCFGAFPVAVGVIWVAEKYMKKHWPSGRTVTLTPDSVSIQTENSKQVALNQAQGIVPLAWHFDLRGWQRVGRERQVPQSWLCLAVELKAGKQNVIVFTYLPPSQAERWLENDAEPTFHQIQPQRVYDSSLRKRLAAPQRPEIPAEIITSKDGPYWLAERRRWLDGFELPPEEFEIFMNHLQTTLKL
ncbi:hypothetical protein [Candidatus Leptofilum sp.]|uniref:hypothetical protein n=1 Tax=Candidatus Leptofilum sp. TaxID=3241576 RepID=UPI003B592AA3